MIYGCDLESLRVAKPIGNSGFVVLTYIFLYLSLTTIIVTHSLLCLIPILMSQMMLLAPIPKLSSFHKSYLNSSLKNKVNQIYMISCLAINQKTIISNFL